MRATTLETVHSLWPYCVRGGGCDPAGEGPSSCGAQACRPAEVVLLTCIGCGDLFSKGLENILAFQVMILSALPL